MSVCAVIASLVVRVPQGRKISGLAAEVYFSSQGERLAKSLDERLHRQTNRSLRRSTGHQFSVKASHCLVTLHNGLVVRSRANRENRGPKGLGKASQRLSRRSMILRTLVGLRACSVPGLTGSMTGAAIVCDSSTSVAMEGATA